MHPGHQAALRLLAADPAARWVAAVAMTASAARLVLSVRLLRPVLAYRGRDVPVGREPDWAAFTAARLPAW